MFDVLSIAALAPVAPATGGADMSAEDGDFGALMKAFAGEAGNGEAGSDPAATVDVRLAAGVKAAPRPDAGVPLHLSIAPLIQDGEGLTISDEVLGDTGADAADTSGLATASDVPTMEPASLEAEAPSSNTAVVDTPTEPSVPNPAAFVAPPSLPIGTQMPSQTAPSDPEAQIAADSPPEAAARAVLDDAGLQTAEKAAPKAPLDVAAPLPDADQTVASSRTATVAPLPGHSAAPVKTDVAAGRPPETIAASADPGAASGVEVRETVPDDMLTERPTPEAPAPDVATGGAGSRGAATVATPADLKAPSALAKVLADAGVTRLVGRSATSAKDVAEPAATGPQTGSTEDEVTTENRTAAASASAPSSFTLPKPAPISAVAQNFGRASAAELSSPAPSASPTAVTNAEVSPPVATRDIAPDSRLGPPDHREAQAQASMSAAEGDVAPEPPAPVEQPKPAKASGLMPALASNDVIPGAPADAIPPFPPFESEIGSALTGTGVGGATSLTPATAVTSILSSISAATAETTAALGAQILRRLEGRSTRFEIGLTPEGLGQVDVTLEIDAEGGLTARLAFDSPISAAELRGRADELRRQLQEAGFSVAQDALSFAERDAGQSGGGDGRSAREFLAESARAFAGAERLTDAAETALALPAWAARSLTPTGVDVKV